MSAPVVAFSGLVLLIAALVAFLIWAGSDRPSRGDSANALDWVPYDGGADRDGHHHHYDGHDDAADGGADGDGD
jgi:hypothetical protein